MFLHRSRRKLFPPAPWGPPVLAGACLLLAALVFLRVSLSAAKNLPSQEDSSLAQSISVGDASEETVWDEGEEPESQEDSAASSSLSQAVLQPEALQAGEYKIIWKPVTTTRIDAAALRKALPDVAARFTKETTVRRFSVA